MTNANIWHTRTVSTLCYEVNNFKTKKPKRTEKLHRNIVKIYLGRLQLTRTMTPLKYNSQ